MEDSRKIDELGRIVLPFAVRQTLGWGEKTPMSIQIEGDSVILRRHEPSCIYCGMTEHLKEYRAKHLCITCQSSIAAL